MSFSAIRNEVADVQSRREFNRAHLTGLTAWDRHKLFINQFQAYGKSRAPAAAPTRTDADVLREQHRFIRDDASDEASASWEVRLACKYYRKLVKEYAICDLSAYKESRVGLRWRTEQEVVRGKGQFECGARGCSSQVGLATFELPFHYREAGESKQALVKVRVCQECAVKLNWRKEKKLKKLEKALLKHAGKRGAPSLSPDEHAADAIESQDAKRIRRADDSGGVAGKVQSQDSRQDEAKSSERATTGADKDTPAEQSTEAPPLNTPAAAASDAEIWKQKQAARDVSIEDEFDAYLADMFV